MKMKMGNKVEVGQELVFVRNQNSHNGKVVPQVVRVDKVGHKWIHISSGHRVFTESLQVDGGAYSSPGSCYLSLEEYQNKRNHSIAWHALRRAVSNEHLAPAGVSTDQILQAMQILGLPAPTF